jgi:NAD(P)-dependent dehydrogenase (short-subunit alcohol dehydrogenase family)
MGAATRARLEAAGQRVVGVDLRDAEVVADLGTPEGRSAAVDAVTDRTGGRIDGLVTWAGIAGLTDGSGALLASVNYFGTIALLEGLRPLLARGDRPAAVAISSNSTTVQP